MALSLMERYSKRIQEARQLKHRMRVNLIDNILKNYQIPIKTSNGKYVKYRNGHVKTRHVADFKDFQKHFSVLTKADEAKIKTSDNPENKDRKDAINAFKNRFTLDEKGFNAVIKAMSKFNDAKANILVKLIENKPLLKIVEYINNLLKREYQSQSDNSDVGDTDTNNPQSHNFD